MELRMKKTIVITLALMLFAGTAAFAESNLPAVDIEEANAEIEQLNVEIAESQSSIKQSNADIEAEGAKAEDLNKKIIEVDGFLNQIQEEIRDLADFKKRVADSGLNMQTDDALLRATGIKKSLKQQRDDLSSQLNTAMEDIAENRRQIRVRNAQILKKQERILILQTAINVTEQQKEEASALFSNVDSIMSNAEKYISAGE